LRFEEKDAGKVERSRVYGRKGWICKSKGHGGWEMPRAQEDEARSVHGGGERGSSLVTRYTYSQCRLRYVYPIHVFLHFARAHASPLLLSRYILYFPRSIDTYHLVFFPPSVFTFFIAYPGFCSVLVRFCTRSMASFFRLRFAPSLVLLARFQVRPSCRQI
jgi:hypothetical protein